jgi:protein-L-isoaspartate(D-aspartate) O-methyltransferase
MNACRLVADLPRIASLAGKAYPSVRVGSDSNASMADGIDEASVFAARRQQLVDSWVDAHAVRAPRILAAMRSVPREIFVPAELRARAYEDAPLPIGLGQTISQPLIVARMAEALELTGQERVLEVGTGSGYAAAVLSLLAREVHTVEWLEELGRTAEERLRMLGSSNVAVHIGDGSRGWPAAEPYDAIVVAAAGPAVPDELLRQVGPGGRLVMPIGERDEQTLVRVRRTAAGFAREELEVVRFVPLMGACGWTTTS